MNSANIDTNRNWTSLIISGRHVDLNRRDQFKGKKNVKKRICTHPHPNQFYTQVGKQETRALLAEGTTKRTSRRSRMPLSTLLVLCLSAGHRPGGLNWGDSELHVNPVHHANVLSILPSFKSLQNTLVWNSLPPVNRSCTEKTSLHHFCLTETYHQSYLKPKGRNIYFVCVSKRNL